MRKEGRGDLTAEDRGLDTKALLERRGEMAASKQGWGEKPEMVEVSQDHAHDLARKLCDGRHCGRWNMVRSVVQMIVGCQDSSVKEELELARSWNDSMRGVAGAQGRREMLREPHLWVPLSQGAQKASEMEIVRAYRIVWW